MLEEYFFSHSITALRTCGTELESIAPPTTVAIWALVVATTIASQAQPALQQRQGVYKHPTHCAVLHLLITNSVEYILRVLQAKNITFRLSDQVDVS